MDIEKTLVVAAPPARVWALLLDPKVMGDCVPGMKSIEVLSDTEYLAQMHVKIAFVAAKFRIRTKLVEQRAPHYLRTEGSGDDASVASSFRQTSEMFLDELPDGRTSVRTKVKVDVLGRLGTFGLSVMKTKADRMWDEFGANFAERVAPVAAGVEAPILAAVPAGAGASAAAPAVEPAVVTPPLVAQPAVAASTMAPPVAAAPAGITAANGATVAAASSGAPPIALPATPPARPGWLARLLGVGAAGPGTAAVLQRQPGDICIEVRRGDSTVTVLWPAQSAGECAAWLREVVR